MSIVPGQAATEKGMLGFVLALVCGKRMGSNIVKIYLIFLPGEKKSYYVQVLLKHILGTDFLKLIKIALRVQRSAGIMT